MACTLRQAGAWRSVCRRCPPCGGGGMGSCGVAGPMWAAALGGCEWLESWKLGRTLDDAVLDLVRRLADAPLPDPPPVLRALLGHTLDEVLLRGLTALYSLLGCEEPQRQSGDGDSDGAAVSATWLDAQYKELAEDEKRLGPDHPSVRERQATLDQLSSLLRQSQKRGTATSTAGSTSWDPSRASSVTGGYGATTAGTTEACASLVASCAASAACIAQERRLTERSPSRNASRMPEWMLPGVAETEEESIGDDGDGKMGKSVHFAGDERAAAGVPCVCCDCGQAARPTPPPQPPPQPRPPSPLLQRVCPCGKTTRISFIKHPECVCNEPSSDYFTGRGTSAMPSCSDAACPEIRRRAKEVTDSIIEQATGDSAASKVAAKRASSVRSGAPGAPLVEKAGDGGPGETDWHSAAESTPRLKSAAQARAEPSGVGARATPCPCCPCPQQRRRRPRGPANCPEQILWAVTKICVYQDASRTYEVLTPSFEKPPRATGRTHVVFAMRAPDKSGTS